MKTYLVGGAVRDAQLNYPYSEKDWVVVGATDEDMIAQGFQRVGKDFPVFLHPETKEEYALARMEKKVAAGYKGFEFLSSPKVTLEQDLLRRDLTINAIAQAKDGKLIDPYNGLSDLKNRILRHVSPAFSEDPVRLLRVARFIARYHHLGFTVAPETIALLQKMVKNGEVNALVAERSWKEFEKALVEKHPEKFLNTLNECESLSLILPGLENLFCKRKKASGLSNLIRACAFTHKPSIRFSALILDLKHALKNENKTLDVLRSLSEKLKIPTDYRELAELSIKHESTINKGPLQSANKVETLFSESDAFRKTDRFIDLLTSLKNQSDTKNMAWKKSTVNIWIYALKECLAVNAQQFVAKGLKGKQIGEAVRAERIARIQQLQKDIKETLKLDTTGD